MVGISTEDKGSTREFTGVYVAHGFVHAIRMGKPFWRPGHLGKNMGEERHKYILFWIDGRKKGESGTLNV